MHRIPDSGWLAAEVARLATQRLAVDPPLRPASTEEELREEIGPTITPDGVGLEKALRLWTEEIAPRAVPTDHPRYLAFIPSAPTDAAALFDALVSAGSIYGGTWLEASGAVYAENEALRWLADLAQLPAGAGGCFVQGGTAGNISALVAARHAALERRGGSRPRRWAVAMTEEAHSSAAYAVQQVMDAEILLVPTDDAGRMTGIGLEKRIAEQGTDGLFAVVATAGTTNLGLIDDLEGIAGVCERHGLWMHVDGAYGGAAMAAPSVRPLFAGIERADSFIVDPHKWLFAPYDSCALVYRNPELARVAHTQHAAYLDAVVDDGRWNPSDYAIHLTRRARGLPLWFSLSAYGTLAYSAAVEACLAIAHELADEIRRRPSLQLVMEPSLSIVVFERLGWGHEDYARWSERCLRDGIAFLLPTVHRGRPCARVAIINPRTTLADLAHVLDSMV